MAYEEAEPEGDTDNGRKPKLSYMELMQADNIAEKLDDTHLGEISAKAISEYDIDESSRSDWLKTNESAIKLAMMVSEDKTYPFDKASNVKYPLIASAALQFNARAYPAICPPDRVVKCKTYGRDPDGKKAARAERVSEFMSWQLLSQLPEWEEDTDRLTVILPIVGCAFRKVFRDPSLGRNVTRLVTADRMVFNYWARSFNDLPRMTELMTLYPYEIQERINDGRFLKFDYSALDQGTLPGEEDKGNGAHDDDGPHLFLEQHRLLDLDGDDYPEPYVVTVHKASGKVCRIKANWSADTAQIAHEGDSVKVISLRRESYYVRYTFLPAADGGAYGLGFGWLLASTNDAINTTLNQTFDAAHMSTIQGGFVNASLGLKMKNHTFRFQPGEWKMINTAGSLRDAMQPMDYKPPSPVLMTLLEFLINSGKELASIKDVLTGDTPATAPVGTTQMLIEQGLQVFTSIYKRVHRALREELALHASLNERYVTPEEYQQFFDEPQQGADPNDPNAAMSGPDPQADFNSKDFDVQPVTDPQSVTKAQKIAKAQTIYALSKENPTMNPMEATKRVLEAIEAEDVEQLLVPPQQPDPEVEALAKRAAVAEVEAKEGEAEAKNADATSKLAAAMKTMAEAGQIDVGQIAGSLEMLLKMITTEHGMEMDLAGQGGVPGMEGQPGNPMGAGAPPLGSNGPQPGLGGDAGQPVTPPPDGMGGAANPVGGSPGAL